MSVLNIFVQQKRSMSAWLFALLTLFVVAILMFAATGIQALPAQTAFLRGLTTTLLFGLLSLATALLFGLLGRGLNWLLPLTKGTNSPEEPALPDNLGWLFAVALLVLLASSTLYTQFNGLLHGFHQPGAVAAGIESATSLLTPGRRAQEMYQARLSWQEFTTAQSAEVAQNAPITVLTWALLVDSLALVPAYGLVLGLLIIWSRPLVANQPGLPPFRRWSPTTVLWFLAIAMAADWLENTTTLEGFTRLWFTSSLQIGWESILLTGFTLVKWLGLLLVLLYLLGEAWLYVREEIADLQSIAKALLAVRVPLLLVTLFGVALLVHEQVPDILRRFADPNLASVGIGGVGLLATLLLAFSIWYSSSWMLVARPTYLLKGPPTWVRRFIILGALLCVILFLLDGFNARATGGKWGWKPLLPLLLAIPFWLLTQFPDWLVKRCEPIWHWLTRRWSAIWRKPHQASSPDVARPAKTPLESEQIPLLPEALTEHDFLPKLDWIKEHGPRVLGGTVLVILAIALLRSTAGLILYNHLRGLPVLRYALLLGVAFLLLGGVSFAYWAMGRPATSERLQQLVPTHWSVVSLILLGGVISWGALLVWWIISPTAVYNVAPLIGPIGLLSLNLLLINFILCAVIAIVNEGSQRPGATVRLPVLTTLALWFVLASILPPRETLHDVFHRPVNANFQQRSDQGQEANQVQDIETLFDRWRCRNHILPPDDHRIDCPLGLALPADQPQQAVPLVLIATAGGGIRAAVWTAYVLDRVLGYDGGPLRTARNLPTVPRLNRVLAISSVSGGSLGVASYIARLTSTPAAQPDAATAPTTTVTLTANAPPPVDPCQKTDGVSDQHWVCTHLSRDAISPALAWLMFVEAPWSLLHFDLGWNLLGEPIEERDRARVLEESWERAWQSETASKGLATDLFALNALADTDQAHVPLLVFNGTTVESGCRMNTSVLKSYEHVAGEPVKSCLDSTNPMPAKRVLGATLDLVDFLCKSDELPLSKAALLSARFPLISPSGRVTQCLAESPTVTDTKKLTEALETYVVDGGYLENSGADTALELWLALQPLVAKHNQNNALLPIIPFFIQIDNGYAEPAAPGGIPSAPQLLVPLLALGATLDSHQAMARQVAENLFSRPYTVEGRGCFEGQTRYAHFIPQAHPGPEAPLGWALSQGSFSDLSDQFLKAPVNQAAQATVQSWFANVSFSPCP